MQADSTGNDRSQAQQRRQVEHVRTEDDPGANRCLVVRQRGDRGRDLWRIGRQRGHHAEQGFGEPEALTDSLEARNEHPTGAQAHNCPDDEGQRRTVPRSWSLRSDGDEPARNGHAKIRQLSQAR